MKCKKKIRNSIILTMLISLPILSKTSIANADSIEDEFLSVINKYDLKDIVVENGIILDKGKTLDLSKYPNWELSDNQTIEINSDGVAKAVNEGTVFLSQRIGEKVYIVEIYVPEEISNYNIKPRDIQPRGYYKVFIDAGHGGSDSGALGFGYKESDLNLQIAKKVESILKSRGIDVRMSRSSDTYYSLSERAEMANNYGADAFVSIHQNSASSASANGIETYYNRNKEQYKPLSNDIQKQLINQTGATNRGVKNAGFVVLVQSNMISSLVECGFISNESEVKKLSDSAYQDKLAEGIANGIENYLKSNVIIEESQITATGKVIKTDSLNVRTGPSTSFDIIGTLSDGEKVNIIGKISNWYKIEYNDTYGYVSQSYIELGSTEPDQDNDMNSDGESQITVTGKVVKTDSLNVRTGPSTSFDIIGTLSDGEKINIVGKINDWYKIEYNNTYGYVSASYIELDATEPEEDDTIPDQNNAIDFTDVSEIHWAYPQVQDFVQKGYINGYEDNTFRPNEPIKRNEFIKIFNKVFGLTNKSGIEFEDTKGNWASDEIDIAVTNGVAQGVGDNKFEPEKYVTREEAAKMLANYMKIEDKSHDEIKKFQDYNKISEWAKDALEGNVKKGYIKGTSEGTLAPKNNMTRAEVVTLLSRVNN